MLKLCTLPVITLGERFRMFAVRTAMRMTSDLENTTQERKLEILEMSHLDQREN